MKRNLSLAALAVILAAGTAQAQTTVKIGVMSDMSSLYADIGGPGSTVAAKMAIADFMAANKDIKVELLSAERCDGLVLEHAGHQQMLAQRWDEHQ